MTQEILPQEASVCSFTKRLEIHFSYLEKKEGEASIFNPFKGVKDQYINLDLLVFYRKKDGTVGAVVDSIFLKSENLNGNSLPFMMFCGEIPDYYDEDNGLGGDVFFIYSLDEIDEVFFLILDYDAAVDSLPEFNDLMQHGVRIDVINDLGVDIRVPLVSHSKGYMYVLCSIKSTNNFNDFTLRNESRLITLEDALLEIPGFSLICDE